MINSVNSSWSLNPVIPAQLSMKATMDSLAANTDKNTWTIADLHTTYSPKKTMYHGLRPQIGKTLWRNTNACNHMEDLLLAANKR